MERRKLLQALTALPAMVITGKSGEQVGLKYEVKPDKKYIIFINPATVDIDEFCRGDSFPAGTPVYAVADSDMDNAIRIYEIEKDSE